MGMKGLLEEDYMPIKKYKLLVLGLPPLTPISVGEIEDELNKVTLPDRTTASGGERMPGETDVVLPAHHSVENTAMELWFLEGQDPVAPTYKKEVTILIESSSGSKIRGYILSGTFLSKRVIPALEMESEGDMANITWTFSYDDVLPLPG